MWDKSKERKEEKRCKLCSISNMLCLCVCIGDDRSNEDMFEAIAASVSSHSLQDAGEVFACTAGQKRSMAKYYLDDMFQVIRASRWPPQHRALQCYEPDRGSSRHRHTLILVQMVIARTPLISFTFTIAREE